MRSNFEYIKAIKLFMEAGIREDSLVSSCETIGIKVISICMGRVYHSKAYWTSSAGKVRATRKYIRIQLTRGEGKNNRAKCAELDIDGTVEVLEHINLY